MVRQLEFYRKSEEIKLKFNNNGIKIERFYKPIRRLHCSLFLKYLFLGLSLKFLQLIVIYNNDIALPFLKTLELQFDCS